MSSLLRPSRAAPGCMGSSIRTNSGLHTLALVTSGAAARLNVLCGVLRARARTNAAL